MERWTATILAGVALAACGCTAISLRPENAVRTAFHLSPSAAAVDAAAFGPAMDRLTDSQATPGNAVCLLTNGAQGFPSMLAAIDAAQHRIRCESYILRADATGTRFVEALTRAASRGVAVRLLVDGVGSRSLTHEDLGLLIAQGAQVRIFNPLSHWTVIRANNRNHRKILVVDGRVAFLGGLNLAQEYDGDGRQGWRDTHLRIEGPAALDAERVFAQSWQQGGTGFLGKDLPVVGVNPLKRTLDRPLQTLLSRPPVWTPPASADRAAAPVGASPPVPVRIVSSAPDRTASHVLDMYLLAINAAQERVWIANGYFVPPRILLRALCHAARRGVDVRLLLQGETDEPTVRTLSIGFYGKLLGSGVRIYEWPHSVLHAKTMVVDGAWCTIGSANLDGRALFLNYEANAALLDRGLGRAMEEQFVRDLAASRPVCLDDWQARPLPQKFREALLAPVRGQF